MKIMFHGKEPTILPCYGSIEPGLVELPDELALALLAASEKTGDYSDPSALDLPVVVEEPTLDLVTGPTFVEPTAFDSEPYRKARRTPREE